MSLVPPPLPMGAVLAVTTATQAFSTLGALALAAVAPEAAARLGVSGALIGYQVGLVFFGAMLAAPFGGGVVARLGAVRTSQVSLWLVAAGLAIAALGTVPLVVLGTFLMGLGYGTPSPAASHLLARVRTERAMNLIYSIKQTGVPIGGVLSGLLMPPLTVSWGWQAALAACAVLVAGVGWAVGLRRAGWDADRKPGAPVLAAPLASVELVWRHGVLRWLAVASFVYSGAQLCLTGFLVTYLVAEVQLGLLVAGSVLAATHAAGAVGRLAWGWVADRLGSGALALVINGALSMAGAIATASMSPAWPLWAVALTSMAFGFCAMGWNGVYIAVIARQSPPGQVSAATGGSLAVTYAGVIFVPPLFAALHDPLGVSYGTAYALLAFVTATGIACLVQARRHRARAP